MDSDNSSSGLIRVIHVVNAQKQSAVKGYLQQFQHAEEDYHKMISNFGEHLSSQLKTNNGSTETSMQPCVTPINRLVYNDPQPGQNCVFVDFGGKNFRVGCCFFSHASPPPGSSGLLHTELQIYPVPKRLLSESLETIVDFIAAKVIAFCKSKVYRDNVCLPEGTSLRIAFVFSFPFDYIENDRSRAVIRRFTKQIEFTSDGKEVGAILEEKLAAFDLENKIKFKVDCILNDTSATLLSFVNTNIYDSSIVDSTNCLISLIFGTGCNIAYYDNSLNRLVCTEVGGYGEKGELDFIKTEIDDLIINERSCHVGEQAFEKFGISDPYLGEAVRLIIVAMIRKEHLFVESSLDRDIQEDPETSVIEQERSLSGSEFVTKILKNRNNVVQVQDILAKYNLFGTFSDCKNIIDICETISKRAAKMVAAILCAIVLRINRNQPNNPDKNLVVACDGNLWRKHPTLQQDTNTYLHDFLRHYNDDSEIRFNISTMSSGPGAAACCFGRLWE